MKKIILLSLCLTLLGCNKVVVRAKDRPVPQVLKSYSQPFEETFEATKKGLSLLGYEVSQEEKKGGRLFTKWEPTKAVSHYTDLFEQKDYGTVGAYYRLEVWVRPKNGKTEVLVSAPLRSVVGHQQSTTKEEKKLLKKIADILRRDEFELTNVGAGE